MSLLQVETIEFVTLHPRRNLFHSFTRKIPVNLLIRHGLFTTILPSHACALNL